jgi:hypothetical protein
MIEMQVEFFHQQQSIADCFSTKDQKPHLKKGQTFYIRNISMLRKNFIIRLQYRPSKIIGAKAAIIIIKLLGFEA